MASKKKDRSALLENLIRDCRKDLAGYLPPDSGVSASEVISSLLGRLDGPQARKALGEDLA